MSGGLGFALLIAVAVAIWWRNHDILSDLYDYSSIMAAAGKIEAGLKPYVDFRSTMQSSTYLLNRGVELVFGRDYLSLTIGGLAVSLLGAGALFALWRRSFGNMGGLMLTAAVVWAGLAQHVVVFYNPVGILCLAIVVTGVAYRPRFSRLWSWDQGLVLGALVLGGVNKINFQFLGLALAAVLVIDAHMAQRINRRDMMGSLLVLVGAGVVVPLLVEWTWTGASPALWFENVVLLAGERVDAWHRLGEAVVYVGPAHDLHHNIPFKQLTAFGLGLLAVVGFLAWGAVSRTTFTGKQKMMRAILLVVFLGGAALGGVLLTITNVETIALTSLAFLIAAAALWVATGQAESTRDPRAARYSWLLPAAGLFWAIDGGTAAWNGSRVLFARQEVDRSVFVRLEQAPPTLRYLEGVRLDANLHQSLLLVARELEQMKSRRGDLSGVLFGPTFEWLERAYPETILPGMPVWYHVGTSLRADDGDWLAANLTRHQVNRILAHPSWEIWPTGFQTVLTEQFRAIPLGAMARLHEKIGSEQTSMAHGSFGLREPLTMIERTGSNLHLLGSPVPEGFGYATSPWGDFLGRAGGWTWDWCGGLTIVEGQIVAQRSGDPAGPARFSVVISALEPPGAGEELWRTVATIEAGQTWARLPFRITPYGRSVRVKVEPLEGAPQEWRIGCREVQIRQTVNLAGLPPPPTTVAVTGHPMKLACGKAAWFRSAESLGGDHNVGQTSPWEAWTERLTGVTPWKVTLETEQLADGQGTPPVVMLLWYRSGRVELLSQQAIERDTPTEVSFQGSMAEPGGWLGVAVRPMEAGKTFNMKVRVKEWHY